MSDQIRRMRRYADELCAEADAAFARMDDARGERLMAEAQTVYEEIDRRARRQRAFHDCPHC